MSADECTVPPNGWRCTREPGHDGPCAAVPINPDPFRQRIHKAIEDWAIQPQCDKLGSHEIDELTDALRTALQEGEGEAAGHDFKVPAPPLARVLAHFESEANAADELIRNTGPDAMSGRYEVPWCRRYEIERDTYRYVLEQIAAAQPSGGEGEGEGAYDADEIRDCLEEAIWEHERSPETSIWFSFWDRIAGGGQIPEMSALVAAHPHDQEAPQVSSGDGEPWDTPGETPLCDCPADGLKRLDQHADECTFRIASERLRPSTHTDEERELDWPEEIWIGFAGHPYISKSPTVLGESGPVALRYVPEWTRAHVEEACTREAEIAEREQDRAKASRQSVIDEIWAQVRSSRAEIGERGFRVVSNLFYTLAGKEQR